MQYMLDTNTCIYIIKDQPESVQTRLQQIPVGAVSVSSIVVAELSYGVEQSTKKEHNRAALEEFLRYTLIEDWPAEASEIYGKIRTGLKTGGSTIGAMDLLIAAHTLYTKSILVTDNLREFERVPGLKLENWK